MQFCNSSDNNPEPGGPGTVYFDGYKSGSRHRVLSVDNQGRRPRVSFNSFYRKKPTETVLEKNEKDRERQNKPNQANNGPIILYRLKGGGGKGVCRILVVSRLNLPGSISVSGQLPTYPSPNPTTVN